MATPTPATASRDRAVRRAAQARAGADRGGKGGMGLLVVAGGLGALGVWELMKGKKGVNPVISHSSYPAWWASATPDIKAVAAIWYLMLHRWPDPNNMSGPLLAYHQGIATNPAIHVVNVQAGGSAAPGAPAVIYYIAAAAGQEALTDILPNTTPATDPTTWVNAAYQWLFGRQASAAVGLKDWVPWFTAYGPVSTLYAICTRQEFLQDASTLAAGG